MTQDRSWLMVPNWPTVKINSTSRASIHILSRAIVVVFEQMSGAGKKYPRQIRATVSPGRQIPRMSGQCGARHTPVTLYRASKYGTGEGRHTRSRLNDSSPPKYIYTTGDTDGRRGEGVVGWSTGRSGYICFHPGTCLRN